MLRIITTAQIEEPLRRGISRRGRGLLSANISGRARLCQIPGTHVPPCRPRSAQLRPRALPLSARPLDHIQPPHRAGKLAGEARQLGDLLESMRTRVVAPLLKADAVANAISTLNPLIEIDSRAWLLMPQLMAALTTGELGERVGSLAQMRDEITRPVDALLSGI